MSQPIKIKNLLVLYTTVYSSNADYGRRVALLQEELGDSYYVKRGALLDLEFWISDSKLRVTMTDDTDLKDMDAVFFARWSATQNALATAVYLDQAKVPYKTHQMRHLAPMDKLGEHALLAGGDITLPETVITSIANIKRNTYRYIQSFKQPVILKKANASMGKDNFLIQHYKDIFAVLDQYKETDIFMLQQYIPNHEDYRVLVFDGTAKTAIRRRRVNSEHHVNNTKQGAASEEVSLTPRLAVLAEQAAQQTNRAELAGVDIIIDEITGTPYVLEVNKMPVLVSYPLKPTRTQALIEFIRSI